GNGDFWAASVEGLRERLNEALRRSGDEGELHVVPVCADGVVDDCPALEGGIAVGLARKDHTVGSFPNGHFADVADAELARAGAEGVEREMAKAGRVRGREQFEVAIELALKAEINGT